MVHLNYIKNGEFNSCLNRVSPLTGKMTKKQEHGRAVVHACRSAPQLGTSYDKASANTVIAQSGVAASDYEEFVMPFGDYYHHFTILDKDIAASMGGSASAFAEAKSVEFGEAVETFLAAAAQKIWGPVGGALGRITDLNKGGANGEIQLSNPRDAFYFTRNMILQASDSTGAGAPNAVRAGLGYVAFSDPTGTTTGTSTDGWHVKVSVNTADAQNGTTGVSGGPSEWVDGDYLFRLGDIQAGTDLSDKQIRSIQGFIPLTNDTSTYLGASRNRRGMNGFRLTATQTAGLGPIENIKKLVNLGYSDFRSTGIDTIGVSPATFEIITNDIQTNTWQGVGSSLEAGASKIKIHTAAGPVEVIADPNVRNADIWALTMKDLTIYHYNGFPGPVNGDGLQMLRDGNGGYRVEFACYSCVSVGQNPWRHGRSPSNTSDSVVI